MHINSVISDFFTGLARHDDQQLYYNYFDKKECRLFYNVSSSPWWKGTNEYVYDASKQCILADQSAGFKLKREDCAQTKEWVCESGK
jgi:hypothetical protein